MKKTRYIVFTLLAISLAASAQNMTSSPYSRLAYGDLSDETPNTFRGMGGVGIGMRNNLAINPMQPASYTACDSATFMFDLAGSVMWTTYADANGRKNKANGNLEYLMLQLPIWRQHIAFSAGVLPYSSVGYDFALQDSINSDYHYTTSYIGKGGITQIFGGLSFNILDWFAVGANAYYMFGEVTNYRGLAFTEGLSTVDQYAMVKVSSVRTRVGAQLFHRFEHHSFTVGAIWEPTLPLHGDFYLAEVTWEDTISVTQPAMAVPMQWGVGASYAYDNRLTIAFDYQYQDWAHATTYNNQTLHSRAIYSLGAEYRHNPASRNYAARMYWRAGLKIADPYIGSMASKEYKASIGVGFPLRNAATVFNVTLEYDHRGTTLVEDCLKLTLNAAIHENWFFKRRL